LLNYFSPSQICQWLHKAVTSANKQQVTAVIHSDLHNESVVRMFEYVSNSVVSLSTLQPLSCKVVKKLPGKLPKVTFESFSIDEQFNVISSEIESTKPSIVAKKPAVDPANDLTFNLRITKRESEARSKVVLPYIQAGKDADKMFDSSSDFLDTDELEEDPDDDLDI